MSKPDQIIRLDPPNELRFRGPFTDTVSTSLKLSNPLSDKSVCFKIKTTAPRRYCVRPNSGIIEPAKSADINVMLQPFEYDPNEKNKHKFMVQSVVAPSENFDLDKLWKETDPGSLMDSKLKCVFELPKDQPTDNNLDSPNLKFTVSAKIGEAKGQQESGVNIRGDDLSKVQQEARRLQEENDKLRLENSKLKEEGVRQRMVRGIDSASSSATVYETTTFSPSGSSSDAAIMPPALYLVIAIILGILIGKLLL